jgi:hypothetical protein
LHHFFSGSLPFLKFGLLKNDRGCCRRGFLTKITAYAGSFVHLLINLY